MFEFSSHSKVHHIKSFDDNSFLWKLWCSGYLCWNFRRMHHKLILRFAMRWSNEFNSVRSMISSGKFKFSYPQRNYLDFFGSFQNAFSWILFNGWINVSGCRKVYRLWTWTMVTIFFELSFRIICTGSSSHWNHKIISIFEVLETWNLPHGWVEVSWTVNINMWYFL